MLPYSEISYRELKAACVSANVSNLLPENIRHNSVKGAQVYDNFITAIEGLDEDVKPNLPDDVIDYYNMAREFSEVITDPDEAPDPEPLNFDPDETREEFDVPIHEEEEEEPDLITDPVVKVKSTPNPESVVDEQENEDAELEEAPVKKMVRLSTTPMTPKVDGNKLTINFKELGVEEVFNLPKPDDKEKLGVVRKKAMAFAKENGATQGQLCNVGKILNLAGYYMR